MDIVHAMWLFVASLLSLIGISFCIFDCNHEATFSSTVSSSLNLTYGKENIGSSSDRPWVGGSNSSNWVSLGFPRPINLKSIHITGGKVDLYKNNTLVECHIDIFVLHYKSKSGGEWVRDKKYRDVSSNYKQDLDITDSVTSINITIRKYVKCPAIKMIKLFACGVCTKPTDTDEQKSTCTKDVQQCTLTCKQGFVSTNSNNVVKTCQLDGSWSGPDLTCEDMDECKVHNNACGDNETCTNVYKSYKCDCKTGYTGRPNCKDINECASADSNTCHKTFAECINTAGSYTCRCNHGYTGDGKTCKDIDECKYDASNACHKTLAKCENSGGGYYCRCNQGYTGNGVQCTDINECNSTQNDCNVHADCKNTNGSYHCQCKPGFTGDGVLCTDINECKDDASNVCHKTLAKCENSGGGYHCRCKPGYTGDGVQCTDINECNSAQNVCHVNADCKNNDGSYECQCKPGFTGNGMTCTENNPVVITSTFTDKTLRYGEKLKEDCKAEGLPIPTIKWNTPTGNVSGSVLEIPSLTLNHNGDYTCIASNADTFSKKKIAVVVIGTPTSVPKATITKTTATSIHISWRKPSDEGASRIRGYRVFYEVLGDSRDKKRVNASELSAVISNLMPNKQYVISVVAMNKQGMSEMENFVNVFTLASKPDKPPELEMESCSTSSSSVKIQLKKLDHDHTTELRVQVVVEKVSERSKRNTAVAGIIPAYDKADCEGNSECRYVTVEVKNNETDFVVGDGKMYGKYRNAELEPATAYKISVRGVSYNEEKKENFGDLSESLHVSTSGVTNLSTPDSGNKTSVVIGLSVAVAVLMIAIVCILVCHLWKRKRNKPNHSSGIYEEPVAQNKQPGSSVRPNRELSPISDVGGCYEEPAQEQPGSGNIQKNREVPQTTDTEGHGYEDPTQYQQLDSSRRVPIDANYCQLNAHYTKLDRSLNEDIHEYMPLNMISNPGNDVLDEYET